jgi:hypothetical protein
VGGRATGGGGRASLKSPAAKRFAFNAWTRSPPIFLRTLAAAMMNQWAALFERIMCGGGRRKKGRPRFREGGAR